MIPGTLPAPLPIYQGDVRRWSFRVRERNTDGTAGNPRDLTGVTVRAQIRATAANQQILVSWTAAAAADQVASPGVVLLSLTPAQTAALPAGKAVFDVELTFPNGDVQTYLTGEINVIAEVTR